MLRRVAARHPGTTPPVFSTGLGAIDDAQKTFRAMPGRAALAAVAFASMEGVPDLAGWDPAVLPLWQGLAEALLRSVAESAVVAWLAAAVIRFAVLRAVSGLGAPGRGFARLYAIVAGLLLPNDLLAYLVAAYPRVGDGHNPVLFLGVLVLVVVQMRLMLVVPALAVGAPGATLANAVSDSAGHAWRCFVVLAVNLLGTAVAAGAVAGLAYAFFVLARSFLGGLAPVQTVAVVLGNGLLIAFGTGSAAVAVARLYLFYAVALGSPPGTMEAAA